MFNAEAVTFDICEGNPGALQFAMSAYNLVPVKAEWVFRRLRDNGITGTELYMLWNDCCGRDTYLALRIGNTAPIMEIKKHINREEGRGIPFSQADLEGLFGPGYPAKKRGGTAWIN